MTNTTGTESPITLDLLDETDPAALLRRYGGELKPQATYITLDLETGRMGARYNPEVGGRSFPMSVHHRRELWFAIPVLTAGAANELLTDLLPLAERIYAGAEIQWDGSNPIGVLDEDARAAEEELTSQISAFVQDGAHTVSVYDAGDWFAEGDGAPEGLTAHTTDDELAEMAREAERECADSASYGEISLLDGAEEWLERRREEMRDELRGELVEVAEEVAELLAKRDEMIRALAAWGDSSRDIAARAGLSHTGVQKIVKRTDLQT